MNDNYLMLNGKRIDLTDEQIEQLGFNKEVINSPFDIGKEIGSRYYYISSIGSVDKDCVSYIGSLRSINDKRVSVANACKDRKLMEQRAMHETLDRLLWRFSCENGELENPWDGNKAHYFIVKNDGFYVSCRLEKVALVTFPSEEIAKQAIDRIVVPFCTTHPDFVW